MDMIFVRNPGPGTRIYRSPSPDVDDLALPPLKWISVDPVFKKSVPFVRDSGKKLFETLETDTPPEDINLDIPDDLLNQLDPGQVELVKAITLVPEKTIRKEHQEAVEVAKHTSDSGIPAKGYERITPAYLREHHRPFLMAILNLEQKHQKRRAVISLVKKQLERIANLPG